MRTDLIDDLMMGKISAEELNGRLTSGNTHIICPDCDAVSSGKYRHCLACGCDLYRNPDDGQNC